MKKFYLKDCPERKAVHMWIAETLDTDKYVKTMKPENDGLLFEFEDSHLDLQQLRNSVDDVFEDIGWHGFLNVYGGKFIRTQNYGGLSLSYNPTYKYKNIPEEAQTLGYPRNNIPDEIFMDNFEIFERIMEKRLDKDIWSESQEYGTHHAFRYLREHDIIDDTKLEQLLSTYPDRKDVGERINKDTYADTWGFRRWSKASEYGYLKTIRDRIKRSPVRSRLAQIKGIDDADTLKKANTYLWHRDESWFYELRINLALDNPENAYGIEIENYGSKSFTPGNWYVWDTYVTHRPYVAKPMPGYKRTNYVLAVSPWFDWNEEEQCWQQNEFYGEKHPVDMVIDGDAIDGLKIK